MDYSKKAEELFKGGCNCAQAVFCAFADDYGIDRDTAIRMTAAFGGGMGRLREVCGAVSGMFLAASFKYASTDSNDAAAKKELYSIIQTLAATFKEENGSIICRELLSLPDGADSPTPEKRTQNYYKKRPCAALCADAARILAEFNENRSK